MSRKYRSVTAVLLIMLLLVGTMPAAAQDNAYALYLTDDESFGFIYPAAWQLTPNLKFGSLDLRYDAGVAFVYLPEKAAELTGGIVDPFEFLESVAPEFDATADDITDLNPGAVLMTISHDQGRTYAFHLFAVPLADGTLGLFQAYVEIDQFEVYVAPLFVIALTMNVFEPGAAPAPDDIDAMLEDAGVSGALVEVAGGDDDPGAFELVETYTTTFGISFDHPAGWFVLEDEAQGMVQTANRRAAVQVEGFKSGDLGLVIFDPAYMNALGGNPAELLANFIALLGNQGGDIAFGDVGELEVGNMTVPYVTLTENESDGVALAFATGDGDLVLVFLAAFKGEYEAAEPLLLEIVQTIRYTAP